MKVLFFHAAANRRRSTLALMGQTLNTLRPFNRFLGQAIHTAKKRQVRYQLPWTRVRNSVTVELTPLDTILLIPRRPPGMRIPNWPDDQEPDCHEQAFLIDEGRPVRIRHASVTAQGLRIEPDSELRPGQTLIWCRVHCQLEREEVRAPDSFFTAGGESVRLIGPPAEDGEHWVALVEGVHEPGEFLVDGEPLRLATRSSTHSLARVFDSEQRPFHITKGLLRAEELPTEGLLRGDNGVRFRWTAGNKYHRSGSWVQLELPERLDTEDLLDPRAAFYEGGVREIWTLPYYRKEAVYKVKRVDQDRYQLCLDRLPPTDKKLYLPVDLRNLRLQKRALRQLTEAPLPHHQGLLRLCEDPRKVRWPAVREREVVQWYALTDETRDGTGEQREFVRKALGTPDLAFLEGPPGSGKTTAICEIVQQLVRDGQRVLLCASTHVAIDNVLERLLHTDAPIDAVRIGRLERVDRVVQATQLDERVEALISSWRCVPALLRYGDAELHDMAVRTIIMAANLTCGTTMGIVSHPLFRDRDQELRASERPITTMPHWDALIVDEASKTLIQEFMVPALMARRWIIVGDVRQLPPFADRADIVANLRELVDEKDNPVFTREHQRARLLLNRLRNGRLQQRQVRWLIVEQPSVLHDLERELKAEPIERHSVVRVVTRPRRPSTVVQYVSVAQLQTGAPEALRIASADWVLVAENLLPKVATLLPPSLLLTRELTGPTGVLPDGNPLLLRQSWWIERARPLQRPYRDRKYGRASVQTVADSQACEASWLARNDLAQELAWRITRLHELRRSRIDTERKRLRADLVRLMPKAVDITKSLGEIRDIGLPSILEVLQDGIGAHRSDRISALTRGLRRDREQEFLERFTSLSFQHRMHPEISEFPRALIYNGAALRNANTIEQRDKSVTWDFGPYPTRRTWLMVQGHERSGENPDEVRVIAETLRRFTEWARVKGTPRRDAPRRWEVACLCFYVKQERALSQMLRTLTGDDRTTRFHVRDAPVEIVCGTVDRFQGREADLVVLSMRNTRRVGFLDSPNRLNVAVTRARQQLLIVGNARYFADCGVTELQELARRTRQVEVKHPGSRRGRKRR